MRNEHKESLGKAGVFFIHLLQVSCFQYFRDCEEMSTRIIDSLMAARNEKVAIDALPDMPADVEAAYAVQGELVARIWRAT